MHTTRTALPRAGGLLLCAMAAGGAAANPPRIVQVSAAKSATVSPIREPSAAAEISTAQPPARTSRRSEFVPIAVPEASEPQMSLPPQLSPEAAFGAELAPAAPSSSAPLASGLTAEARSSASQTSLPAPRKTSEFTPAPAAEPAAVAYEPVTSSAPATASPHSPSLRSPSPHSPSPALRAVAERAMSKAEKASAMAQRGMLYSARTELIEALTLIAQSLDVEHATDTHAKALAAGLTALDEAKDFARSGSQAPPTADVATIAAGHRTALFRDGSQATTSSVIAQQQYFSHAQEQIAAAAGQLSAASQILYRLGRLQTALAAHDADPLALHAPQAIVFHQAALVTDRGNWLAANELGVLYARYGQLPAAKEMLLASVTAHPHVAGWQNLAAVHRKLGETDLAARAEYERQALARSGAAGQDASQVVRWVDAKTFAAASANDVRWPADVAAKPAGGQATSRR